MSDWDEHQMADATREDVLEAIEKAVKKLKWRVRADDKFFIVLLPPLARSTPGRNRWPDEPEETEEPTQEERERERDGT